MERAVRVSDTESLVLDVWSEVLRCPAETIGGDDDITQFGGSIEVIKVLQRLQETLGVRLPLELMLEHTTVRAAWRRSSMPRPTATRAARTSPP